ncbi:hypothetical protein ATN89_17540 [Comamonas thiooxydans]|uniref:hypothetical protein n=1 Tax=Comamonas thiooxydans TaxID=363952 RepID=UPI0007C48EBA|nr:hypothetical protein [Comamonas thiooxydans]OAD82885.1 hypothetical protein ATN89_17540 [Comamonas thiooxydans]
MNVIYNVLAVVIAIFVLLLAVTVGLVGVLLLAAFVVACFLVGVFEFITMAVIGLAVWLYEECVPSLK